ncbi:hypothetical protein O181_091150 [Austropuccinia psidii MF-1]|uniref:Retrotransposon gag domain-containing protein n=1 Tax=Austropuccinia psidii MF-1 TaxID=1389203 RepID=A0A9Q3P7T8_9BASI|nr:hypothetical protein [Austropuccinia psidii MF-1]
MEGAAPSRRAGPRDRSGEAEDEEGAESVEEEESEETEVEAALAGSPEASEAPDLTPSHQPLVSQAELNFLKMMEQIAKFNRQLTQEVARRDTSKAPAFKTPSMKAPDSIDGTKAHKVRGSIQSCQLIFHNDPSNFFSDRKKVLYSTSFLTVRAGKWIEPYLSNISNEDPSYPLNNWHLFETQLFTVFGDPSEVRKAEQELDTLRIKESGQISLYIADFRILMSIIGGWGERAYIHVYRRGLASRFLDQLAFHPGNFDSLQELMGIIIRILVVFLILVVMTLSRFQQCSSDDIMVFSSSEEEHVKNLASVLQILSDNNFFAKASKCVFHASSVEYLGYVVSSEGLKMDSSKVQQILNWPHKKNIKALQSANFYFHFNKNYSKKISAPTSLLKKDSPSIFNDKAPSQFQILKEALTTDPILSHFNPSLPTIVETDSSDYSLGAVLSNVSWNLCCSIN